MRMVGNKFAWNRREATKLLNTFHELDFCYI